MSSVILDQSRRRGSIKTKLSASRSRHNKNRSIKSSLFSYKSVKMEKSDSLIKYANVVINFLLKFKDYKKANEYEVLKLLLVCKNLSRVLKRKNAKLYECLFKHLTGKEKEILDLMKHYNNDKEKLKDEMSSLIKKWDAKCLVVEEEKRIEKRIEVELVKLVKLVTKKKRAYFAILK